MLGLIDSITTIPRHHQSIVDNSDVCTHQFPSPLFARTADSKKSRRRGRAKRIQAARFGLSGTAVHAERSNKEISSGHCNTVAPIYNVNSPTPPSFQYYRGMRSSISLSPPPLSSTPFLSLFDTFAQQHAPLIIN